MRSILLVDHNIFGVGFALSLLLADPASAQSVKMASGLEPTLREVLVDDVAGETWLRFRFTAEQVAPSRPDALSFADIEADLALLCSDLALRYMQKHSLSADKIVVSVADRFVTYGTTDTDATQFFEQFRIVDGNCIWEAF